MGTCHHKQEEGLGILNFSFQRKARRRNASFICTMSILAQTLDPQETVRSKHEFFRSYAVGLKPIPEVIDVVESFRGKLPMAVASGGVREIVNLELEAMGIKELFKAILTADDHIKPKPAPDIFLEAARRLGVEPAYCQVFEDGDLGLEAARSAGMLATDIRLFSLILKELFDGAFDC